MANQYYLYLLYAYGILAFFVLATWYSVRGKAPNYHLRSVLGSHFISMVKWIIIALVVIVVSSPKAVDWVITVGMLGIAVICYAVGVKLLDSYKKDDPGETEDEDVEHRDCEHTIIVHFSKCENNYCANVSDIVPGACVFTAPSLMELFDEAPKSVRFHVEGLMKDGDDVPDWLANGDYDFEFVADSFCLPLKIRMTNIEEDKTDKAYGNFSSVKESYLDI